MPASLNSQNEDMLLPKEQEQEILRRDKEYDESKTTARNWDEIKMDLESIIQNPSPNYML